MRLILTIISITFWTLSPGQIDWSIGEEFKGQVKTIRTISYNESRVVKLLSFGYRDTVADYNVIETRVIQFDKDKRPIKHLWYMNEADTVGYCLWEYDDRGRTVKQTDYRKGNKLVRTIEFNYQSDTLTIKKLFNKNEELYSTWEKHVDSANYQTRNFEIVNGTKDSDYLTIMDDSFLPWKEFEIDSDGNQVQYAEQLYDNESNLISYKFWNQDSSGYTHQEFHYNKDGDIIQIKEFDLNEQLVKSINKQYDEFRNVIRIITQYPSGKAHSERIDYVYDDQGNWTSKKTFWEYDNGKDYETSKTLRAIEYY